MFAVGLYDLNLEPQWREMTDLANAVEACPTIIDTIAFTEIKMMPSNFEPPAAKLT